MREISNRDELEELLEIIAETLEPFAKKHLPEDPDEDFPEDGPVAPGMSDDDFTDYLVKFGDLRRARKVLGLVQQTIKARRVKTQ